MARRHAALTGTWPSPVDHQRYAALAALRECWEHPEMRAALARRDIARAYRLLIDGGMTQVQIHRLTGQSKAEVSTIAAGRPVCMVPLLERIADGLGIRQQQLLIRRRSRAPLGHLPATR